jgi:iron complex outermembrane receptor protein
MKLLKNFILLICILPLATTVQSNFFAQTLTGRIHDGTNPLAGVRVTTNDPSAQITVSDNNGFFELHELSRTQIMVTYERAGFITLREHYDLKSTSVKNVRILMELDPMQFEEVAIIGQKVGLSENTPYTISRLDLKDINFKGQPSGVMGQLQREPGVNAADMGHGISKPFIRGLGFSRVVTIYQGNKLENHQWGADHGLGVNDLGISSVDVIKGPASILYGSGALGGVIILNDDQTYLRDQTLHGTVGTTFNSVSAGVRTYGSIGQSFTNGWFLAAEGAYENHADYRDGDQRLIGNSRFNASTLRLHTGYQGERSRHRLSCTYNNQLLGIIEEDEMEEGESLATFRGDRAMQLPFQHAQDQIISYQLQHTLNSNWRQEFDLSYHYNQREEIEDDFEDIDLGLQQHHVFYNYRLTHRVNQQYTQKLGLQGSLLSMSNMEDAEEILFPNARHIENGVYYLGTYTKKRHTLQGGLRLDYRLMRADANQENIISAGYSLPGNPVERQLDFSFFGVTGSMGYTLIVNDKNRMKVNLSSGFRSPDLAELLSNGPHPGTNRFEVGNVSFGNEQSLQTDIGWRYAGKQWSASVSLFGNYVNNYIYFTNSGDTTTNGLSIWEFRQTNALLYGGEIDIAWRKSATAPIKVQLFGNLIRGYDLNNTIPLTFIPADRIGTQINYSPLANRRLTSFIRNQFIITHNRPGIGELSTTGCHLLDAGVSYSLLIKAHRLSFGVTCFNILNQTYVDHISILRAFEVTAPGRNLMVNIKWEF